MVYHIIDLIVLVEADENFNKMKHTLVGIGVSSRDKDSVMNSTI